MSTPDPAVVRAAAPTALLCARQATVSVDGTVAIRSLELTTRGDRVLLVGSTRPLVTVLAGAQPHPGAPGAEAVTATVTAGELSVLQHSVKSGAHRKLCGIALCEPPLPWRWSVQEYIGWAARLDGATAKASRSLVSATVSSLSLTGIVRARLRMLSRIERRLVVLASAIVSQPAVVLVDNPFDGLDDADARRMHHGLARALDGRGSIISIPQIHLAAPSGELAKTSTDIVLMRDGAVVLQADAIELLASGRYYELKVLERADALKANLAEAGLELVGTGPHHFSLVLPESLGPSTVLAAAARARAPVTSCVPIIG